MRDFIARERKAIEARTRSLNELEAALQERRTPDVAEGILNRAIRLRFKRGLCPYAEHDEEGVRVIVHGDVITPASLDDDGLDRALDEAAAMMSCYSS